MTEDLTDALIAIIKSGDQQLFEQKISDVTVINLQLNHWGFRHRTYPSNYGIRNELIDAAVKYEQFGILEVLLPNPDVHVHHKIVEQACFRQQTAMVRRLLQQKNVIVLNKFFRRAIYHFDLGRDYRRQSSWSRYVLNVELLLLLLNHPRHHAIDYAMIFRYLVKVKNAETVIRWLAPKLKIDTVSAQPRIIVSSSTFVIVYCDYYQAMMANLDFFCYMIKNYPNDIKPTMDKLLDLHPDADVMVEAAIKNPTSLLAQSLKKILQTL